MNLYAIDNIGTLEIKCTHAYLLLNCPTYRNKSILVQVIHKVLLKL